MARVESYPQLVEEIIRRYGQYKPYYGEVEVQMVFDRENHHYELLSVGWHNNQRIHGCVLHIDVKENKIWIQHDGTETGVANDLVEMGVPKHDIILAFYPSYRWQYTDFGVA